jgi:hypothetical protein
MKPMVLISTPFLSYHEILVDEIDLYEDAWGFYPEFCDVIDLLKQVKAVPGKQLTRQLIKRVRQQKR